MCNKMRHSIRGLQNIFGNKKRIILRTQPGFRSETHNAFTEKVNKIPLNTDDFNISLCLCLVSRIFRVHTNKKLNILISFIEVTRENTQEHNPY